MIKIQVRCCEHLFFREVVCPLIFCLSPTQTKGKALPDLLLELW